MRIVFLVVQTGSLDQKLSNKNEGCWYPVKVEKATFETANLKRIDNVFYEICSIENLELADRNASKGKSDQKGVIEHRNNSKENLDSLRDILLSGCYVTSIYETFHIWEQKERLIFKLPYYPDRITHHAIMNVMEPYFVRWFTADSYSCIKGRGISGAAKEVRKALQSDIGTKYCLKLDIKKFYPSVDHEILKRLLRRKIKDYRLLCLLDEIIDSADGLPIGNYLSQYLANFYLTGFDHWLKEVKRVRYYFRYADDMCIFSDSKEYLHQLLRDIKEYLGVELKLMVKKNHRVFPIEKCGLDFVGFVFRKKYVRLRPEIKKNFCRMVRRNYRRKSVAAYNGWLLGCNSIYLVKKVLGNERVQRLRTKNHRQNVYRRQNTDAKNIRQADYSTRLRYQTV